MKRLMLFGTGGLVAALLVSMMLLWPGSSQPAHAVVVTNGTGPEIHVTNLQAVDATHVQFDVDTVAGAVAADPQAGWNLEIKWNPTFFTYSAAPLMQLPNAGSALCPGADSTTFESPAGSGVNMGCVSLSGTYTTLGTMTRVQLTVVSPGCSAITVSPFTGDTTTGSYTISDDFSTPQLTQGIVNATINELGQGPCTPGALPTSTFTPTNTPIVPTNTPGPTQTPTNTPLATASPIGGLRTITPSATPAETATTAAGGPPTQAPTQAPGGGPGPGGAPGGTGSGPTGTIRLPDTGGGGERASAQLGLLGVAVALVLAGSGAGYAFWLRRRHEA